MLKFISFDIVFQEIPDEVTLAVNITGCPNRCPGCHSPWLREDTGNPLTTAALDSLIEPYTGDITCVCLMGGDGEPGEVSRLTSHIKDMWPKDDELGEPGLKTAWYSGCANLPKGFDLSSLDFVKTGPYIENLGGLKSPETNQRLYRIEPLEAGRASGGDSEETTSPDGRFRMTRVLFPKNFL